MDLSSFGIVRKKDNAHFENVYNLICFGVIKLLQKYLLKSCICYLKCRGVGLQLFN